MIIVRPSGLKETLPSVKAPLGPDDKVEGFFQLMGLPLHEEGGHQLELYFDDKLVGSYRFAVSKVKKSVGRAKKRETVH